MVLFDEGRGNSPLVFLSTPLLLRMPRVNIPSLEMSLLLIVLRWVTLTDPRMPSTENMTLYHSTNASLSSLYHFTLHRHLHFVLNLTNVLFGLSSLLLMW